MRVEWQAHAELENEYAISVAEITHLCELVGAPLEAEVIYADGDDGSSWISFYWADDEV